LVSGARWPRAARFDGKTRALVQISDFPVWRERLPLTDFLQFEPVPLSIRATAGFLERTGRSSLRFAPGFRQRVASHLDRMRAIDARANEVAAAE
jgi:DNA (cytosine-5)-methyltransferase 1